MQRYYLFEKNIFYPLTYQAIKKYQSPHVVKLVVLTEQEIYLERYDWTVHVMYDVHSKDAMKVRRHLRDLGCRGIPLEDACNLMLEGEANKGITYSNVDSRKNVVVID
mgnify:FL=1